MVEVQTRTQSGRTTASDLWALGVPIGVLVLVGFVLAYLFVDPAPPDRLVLATGEAGGGYAAFGQAYRARLATFGIEVELRESAGSRQSLDWLATGEVDAAFVQGGVANDADRASVESLGSLFYEPLWVFHRAGRAPERLSQMAGWRIAIGPRGSGTGAVARPLFEHNGVTGEFVELPVREGLAALRDGRIDVACLIASVDSQTVRALLLAEDVELFSFVRAEAYARMFPTLSRVTLPEGLVDLARNVPARDIALVAPAANLAVRSGLHPALVDLLVQAAARIHRRGDAFARPDEFPSRDHIDLPLDAEARRFYVHGPPFLQRYLPFWLATLVDRLKVMLIPLLALLIPLFRAFPPLYRWRVRSRIYRWYGELREIDPRNRADFPLEQAIVDAQRIEDEIAEVRAPASYAQELYDLRLHLEFVQRQLQSRAAEGKSREAGARV